MPNVVTIDQPDVVALIGEAAKKFTRGNKSEAVALAMRRLLKENVREGTLFGAHPGPVRIGEDVDIVGPILDVEPEAEQADRIAGPAVEKEAPAKTPLGKKLMEIRARAIASGMDLLTQEEILSEIENRRGETPDGKTADIC